MLRFLRAATLIGASTGLLAATPALALTGGPFAIDPIKELRALGKTIGFHPFQEPKDYGQGLHLLQQGREDLDSTVLRVLREGMINPVLGIQTVDTSTAFGLMSGQQSRDYYFHVNGIPLCGFQVRAHTTASNEVMILGEIPQVDVRFVSDDEWPSQDTSFQQAARGVAQAANATDLQLTQATQCYYVRHGDLMPMWSLRIYANGLPYIALADAYENVAVRPGFFTVDGLARVYDNGPADGTLTDLTLTNLVGDGTLTSSQFRVIPKDSAPAVRADHQFIFEPMSSEFAQASVFAHVQRHAQYVAEKGFQWYGPMPMDIRIHEQPHGQTNNALFVPADSANMEFPTIYVGDGDGQTLANLPLDSDVVSHEYGHHVIYRTLKSTQGESLILHEGLADFITFSRTDDACLAESICPEQGVSCWVRGQCLRTAENDIAYNDEIYLKIFGHHRGQMISGMLWDLKQSGAMPLNDVTALVFEALSLLRADSGFRDFLLALLLADRTLFGQQYYDAIVAGAESRNLLSFISDVTKSEIPTPRGSSTITGDDNSGVASTPASNSDEDDDEKDKIVIGCGSVAGANTSNSALWWLVLFAVPALAWFLMPQPQQQRVPVKRSRTQQR